MPRLFLSWYSLPLLFHLLDNSPKRKKIHLCMEFCFMFVYTVHAVAAFKILENNVFLCISKKSNLHFLFACFSSRIDWHTLSTCVYCSLTLSSDLAWPSASSSFSYSIWNLRNRVTDVGCPQLLRWPERLFHAWQNLIANSLSNKIVFLGVFLFFWFIYFYFYFCIICSQKPVLIFSFLRNE